MEKINALLERKLIRLGTRLIDQKKGRVLAEPTEDADGFWSGGGNCARDPRDGSLLLLGRYRDAGDSRTGLTAGTRGRELALFRSDDDGKSFAKIRSWDKSDLCCGSTVLSIEGSALRLNKRRVEILVSTEKVRTYPRQVTAFQKPGTGLWSIDRFSASSFFFCSAARAAASSPPSFTADCRACLLYTSPSPRDGLLSRLPSSA